MYLKPVSQILEQWCNSNSDLIFIFTGVIIIKNKVTSISLAEVLTHWGRVTHICVVKLTILSSDNGSSPERRQAIIWTNAGILLIGPLGTNFIEIVIWIETFSFKKMHLKMSFAKWRPFSLGLNVLIHYVKWRIYRSINWAAIALGSGLSSVRYQTIAWTNIVLLSSWL